MARHITRTISFGFFLLILAAFAGPVRGATDVPNVFTTTSKIDLGTLLTTLVTVLAPTLTVLGGYLAILIKQHLNIQQGTADSALVDMVVQRAGGIAYSYLARVAQEKPQVNLHDEALAMGVNHVLASLPDTLKKLDLTPEALARMVDGELGKLMGPDPTISVVPTLQPTAMSTKTTP